MEGCWVMRNTWTKKCPPVVRRSYGRRGGFYLCEGSADCYTCQLILNHSGAQALPCSTRAGFGPLPVEVELISFTWECARFTARL